MSTENLNLSIENDQLTLYKVSLEGDVDALQALLQADELILDRVLTVTSFNETPLHIAAMRNHLHFAKAILARKPNLAHELDSFYRLPLHLASARGYVDIVKELLRANPNACFARDKDGRIPLHLAAMKGRNEVIKELVKICSESVKEKADNGGTILHLCVKYNQLKTLKLLLETVKDYEFVNATDDHGNTILHLASIFKDVEIAKYLISETSMKSEANTLNSNGFTALDAVEHTARDSGSLEIQNILLKAGVKRNKPPSPAPVPTSTPRIFKFTEKYLKNLGSRIEEARGNIMVAATVTASLAYQAGVSPPDKAKFIGDDMKNTEAAPPPASTSYSLDTKFFWIFNTFAMFSSNFIILLMLSGFQLRNKIGSYILLFAVWLTVLSLSAAYFSAAQLNNEWLDGEGMRVFLRAIFYVFVSIVSLHGLSYLIFLVLKMAKGSRKLINWLRGSNSSSSNPRRPLVKCFSA